MAGLVRHRQTKEPVTDRSRLNHRATSRLYPVVTCGFVRDSQPFCDARSSCQVLTRLMRISLDRMLAVEMALAVADQSNHF